MVSLVGCARRDDCSSGSCPRAFVVVRRSHWDCPGFAVGWIGTGCFINGRSCGRVHCRIDGIAFPLLSMVGVLNLLSIISFDWNNFVLAFLIILVSSFVPEWTWKKYS